MSTHPQRFGPAYTLKRERQRRYYHRNGLRLLAAHRWWGYRCSPEVYEQLLSAQAGVCAICKMPETAKWKTRVRQLAVDHDHSTGQIRGLLCAACNAGIGNLRNDPTLLKAAAAYLEIQVERRLTQQVLPVPERNPNHWAKTIKPCAVCGKDAALTSWGLYCSTACSSRAFYQRKRGKAVPMQVSDGRIPYLATASPADCSAA